MIYFGVSGWSYDDWIGPVYPKDLPKRDWLAFIAARVDALEINVTYYRIPAPSIIQGWVEKTPDDFMFTAKLHRSLTHERAEPNFSQFQMDLKPLSDAGKLGAVLAQFPYSFQRNDVNESYLKQLRDGLETMPLVVEFRHTSWFREEIVALLDSLDIGFCAVDQPVLKNLLPPIIYNVGKIGYVRFHGRNAEKWWDHDEPWERYNYEYPRDELAEWTPKLRSLANELPQTFVFANNHYRGKSLTTIDHLREMFEGPG